MEQFTVQLNNATCTVCIGAGVLGRAGALLRQHVPQVRRWALAADENASALYGEWVQSSFRAAGLQVRLFPLPRARVPKRRRPGCPCAAGSWTAVLTVPAAW